MVELTQAQRIILAICIVIATAYAGFAADKYYLKTEKPIMYAGIGAAAGVVINAALYFWFVKKKPDPTPVKAAPVVVVPAVPAAPAPASEPTTSYLSVPPAPPTAPAAPRVV
jgi:hypothetical protein